MTGRRFLRVLAAAMLATLLPACGGGSGSQSQAPASTTTTDAKPTEVRSADGQLVVVVPPGAATEEEIDSIEIQVRTAADAPPELADATFRGSFYRLLPDGMRFDEPITITRTIDPVAASLDLSKGVPGFVFGSRSSDGKWELLDDQRMLINDDGMVEVSGKLSHFTDVFAFHGGVALSMIPTEVAAKVGSGWRSVVTARVVLTDVHVAFGDVSAATSGRGVIQVDKTNSNETVAAFECSKAGQEDFMAAIVVKEAVYSNAKRMAEFFGVPFEAATATVVLHGHATCEEGSAPQPTPPPKELALAGVVCVTHKPFGRDPSYLTWLLELSGDLPPGSTFQLHVNGMNNDEPASAPVNGDGSLQLKAGITSYGDKEIKAAVLRGGDGTAVDLLEAVTATFGTSIPVTAREGRAAGSGECP